MVHEGDDNEIEDGDAHQGNDLNFPENVCG